MPDGGLCWYLIVTKSFKLRDVVDNVYCCHSPSIIECFPTFYMATCSPAQCFRDLNHTSLNIRTKEFAGLNLKGKKKHTFEV